MPSNGLLPFLFQAYPKGARALRTTLPPTWLFNVASHDASSGLSYVGSLHLTYVFSVILGHLFTSTWSGIQLSFCKKCPLIKYGHTPTACPLHPHSNEQGKQGAPQRGDCDTAKRKRTAPSANSNPSINPYLSYCGQG